MPVNHLQEAPTPKAPLSSAAAEPASFGSKIIHPEEFLKFLPPQPINDWDATRSAGLRAPRAGCNPTHLLPLMTPTTLPPHRATRLRLALLSACLVSTLPGLEAGPVHAPNAPYSVTVGGSSSIFNTVVGFNGSRADFGSSWGSTWNATRQNYSSGLQTFTATFHADAGNVFTSANLGFGQWSFAVPEGGWLWFSMDWSLPGGTYLGNNNLDDDYFSSPGGISWNVGAGQGNYQYWHKSNQGGGGMEFMPIMDFHTRSS
jgi:hypothetical protein